MEQNESPTTKHQLEIVATLCPLSFQVLNNLSTEIPLHQHQDNKGQKKHQRPNMVQVKVPQERQHSLHSLSSSFTEPEGLFPVSSTFPSPPPLDLEFQTLMTSTSLSLPLPLELLSFFPFLPFVFFFLKQTERKFHVKKAY